MTLAQILALAQDAGASDIHLAAGQSAALRVAGRLSPVPGAAPLEAAEVAAAVAEVLPERLEPLYEQDGQADFAFVAPSGVRCRANAYRQRGGPALAVRLMPGIPPAPEDLGIPPSVVALAGCPHGMVVVTGPTGSGKTTTLASLIDRVNATRPVHILTLEDPIEYLYPARQAFISQREIGVDAPGFAAGLRAALRQDPDIILVGEMRDLETMATALTAAETGHLVLATMHTADAPGAVGRVVDSFPPHQQTQVRAQLAAVLQGVVAQTLLPRRDGRGRVAAFEVLLATPAVRNLVREGKAHQLASVIQTGGSLGMGSMQASLERLVRQGVVDESDAAASARL